MITLIEALNYRCLRYISRPLKPFHVLVGPNASGKTTFLDVVAFLQDLVSDGLDAALENRTNNPQEDLNAEFRRTGWGERAKAVVLAPELEAWVWGASYPTGDLNGSAVRSISSRSRWRCSDTIPSYAPR